MQNEGIQGEQFWEVLKAAERNNLPAVIELLAQGADPNYVPYDGLQAGGPLHCAAMSGNYELSKVLLDAGADVNLASVLGNTPMHEAACSSSDICKLFIEAGADLEARTTDMRTPLRYAMYDSANPDVVELLVGAGADPNAQDESGATCLHILGEYASDWKGLNEQQRADLSSKATLLVVGGASTNIADADGATLRSAEHAGYRQLLSCVEMEIERLGISIEDKHDLAPLVFVDRRVPEPSEEQRHDLRSMEIAIAHGNMEAAKSLYESCSPYIDGVLGGFEREEYHIEGETLHGDESVIAYLQERRRSDFAAAELQVQTTKAAGSWCPSPQQADAFADRMTAQAQCNSQEAPQQQRARMRL